MIPGYKTLSEICRGKKHVVYRGQSELYSCRVVVKTPAGKFPAPPEIECFQHEHDLLSSLALQGVIKTFGLENYHNCPFLILEDFSGKPVKSFVESKALNLETIWKRSVISSKHLLGRPA